MKAHLNRGFGIGAAVALVAAPSLAVTLSTASSQPATAAVRSWPSHCLDGTKIVAHRGQPGGNENTVPAARTAAEKRACVTEFDVRETANGVLVAMHDKKVDRTTNGRGYVSRMSARKVTSLRTNGGAHPPTFQRMIEDLAGRGIGLQIHLKVGMSDKRLRAIGDKLRRLGYTRDDTQFNSESKLLLRRVERFAGFPTGYTLIGKPSEAKVATAARYGVDVVMFAKRFVTNRWVDFAKSRGTEIGARAFEISPAWAKSMRVRTLVVDRWTVPPQEPTSTPTPTATATETPTSASTSPSEPAEEETLPTELPTVEETDLELPTATATSSP